VNELDAFDPDALRLSNFDLQGVKARPSRRPPRHQPGGKFLRGPVPWEWLDRAGRLPGKALFVGLVLWQDAGCKKDRTLRLNLTQLVGSGVSLDTARRGLRSLEAAGLVSIAYSPGRCLEVTILPVTDQNTEVAP
jgi:hypothetical protein